MCYAFLPSVSIYYLPKKLTEQLHCCFVFFLEVCFIQDLATRVTIGKGKVTYELYYLETEQVQTTNQDTILGSYNTRHKSVMTSAAAEICPTFDLWYYRLGYLSPSRFKLIYDPLLPTTSQHSHPCLICPLPKQHKLPLNNSLHVSSSLFYGDHVLQLHIMDLDIFLPL